MTSNPLLQPDDAPAILGQLEITPPAPDVLQPPVSQLIARPALTAAPHLPHLCLEPFLTLRRYSDLKLAVQSKPQELSFPDPSFPAFGRVHLQSQTLLNPVLYRLQRSLRRRFAAHIDFAVVRVPAQALPSLLYFLIHPFPLYFVHPTLHSPPLRRPS